MSAEEAAARATAFDFSVDAMLLIDPHADAILEANAAACALLGYDRATLRQMKLTLLHEGQVPSLIVFTQAVFAKNTYWTTSLTPRHATGKKLQLEYAGSLIPQGDRPLVLLVLSDLQQRRRRSLDAAAEDHMRSGIAAWQHMERVFRDIERENQLILRAAGEGIYGVNSEGKTTFVNPAAERMLGWSAEELVGRDIHPIVHHTHHDGRHYPHEDCPIYAAFRDGAVHKVDGEVFWRKDGTPVWVEYTSTPIRDRGIVVGAVIVFHDVTERRESEEKLRAALAEVDRLRERLEQENAYLQEEIRIEINPHGIIGHSAAIQKTLRQVQLVAPTDASVMIHGESGTGKELVARAIHEASERRDRPLIRVNCAAIPRELFESEFFGHVKGAFTGALRDRIGRFELADGGTLFLDEVGEIPLELQGKLLRVLQEGHFERVGEEKTRSVDVRVIAATNRDLKQEVQRGRFREDLYFRLNVFPIETLPLRERREDIPLLAQHFLSNETSERKGGLRLSEADARRLSRYDWPGNVRELQNVIERAVILSQNGRLRIDLPDQTPHAPIADGGKEAKPAVMTEGEVRGLERANIVAALRATGGKIFGPGGAAELMDMKPTTLASRIKALKIEARG
nr:sigma 54-interacting transcriptional regulator [Afipia sp. P52-10]